MKVLLCVAASLLATAAIGAAGTVTITDPSAGAFGPTNGGSAPLIDGVSGTTSAGYTYSLTACFEGYCPGEGTPGAGPNYDVTSPLTLHGTGTTVGCGQAQCTGSLILDYDFSFIGVTQNPGTVVPVSFSIDGTATPNLAFGVDGEVQSDNTPFVQIGQVGTGLQGIVADGTGAFSAMFNLGNITFGNGLMKAQLMLFVGNLTDGQFVDLPNSLLLTFGAASAAPEPATLALMLAGIGGLGLIAYRRR